MTASEISKKTNTREYLSGFGNDFVSEAEKDVVPVGRNSPQKVNRGLYAEQLSGSSFVMPRHQNLRSWQYRIRPSVLHNRFERVENRLLRSRPFVESNPDPNQLRWDPFEIPSTPHDWVSGLVTIAGNGDNASPRGSAVHIYSANQSMTTDFFYDADGDLLIVPQSASLELRTEFGIIDLRPGEIAVIPRGIKFQVRLPEGEARGYVLENYGAPFRLPDLGPIGANGLANKRDFETPTAWYENVSGDFRVLAKYCGNMFAASIGHSPLDVVGWHGNYVPYKYDLARFNTVNTVSFDHCDPSIFTVLTSPSELPGTANVDFVIFPPRWSVAENTFRPPYYHRNVMSEYMGLIHGVYDAKQTGFVPGGGSLHNAMSAHGPDRETFQKASAAKLEPAFMGGTLAFMFESSLVYVPTKAALESPHLQKDYLSCWQELPVNFE